MHQTPVDTLFIFAKHGSRLLSQAKVELNKVLSEYSALAIFSNPLNLDINPDITHENTRVFIIFSEQHRQQTSPNVMLISLSSKEHMNHAFSRFFHERECSEDIISKLKFIYLPNPFMCASASEAARNILQLAKIEVPLTSQDFVLASRDSVY